MKTTTTMTTIQDHDTIQLGNNANPYLFESRSQDHLKELSRTIGLVVVDGKLWGLRVYSLIN